MGRGVVFLSLGPKEPGWLGLGRSQKDSGWGGWVSTAKKTADWLSLFQGNKTEGECLLLTIKIVLLTDKLAFFKFANI